MTTVEEEPRAEALPYGHTSKDRAIPVIGTSAPFFIDELVKDRWRSWRSCSEHAPIIYFGTAGGADRFARRRLGNEVVNKLARARMIRIVSGQDGDNEGDK